MKPNRPEEYVAKQWSQTSLRGVARSDGGLQPACRLSGFGLICGPKFGDRDLDPESLAQTEGSASDWGFKAIEDTSGAEAAEAAARIEMKRACILVDARTGCDYKFLRSNSLLSRKAH